MIFLGGYLPSVKNSVAPGTRLHKISERFEPGTAWHAEKYHGLREIFANIEHIRRSKDSKRFTVGSGNCSLLCLAGGTPDECISCMLLYGEFCHSDMAVLSQSNVSFT